MNQKLKQGKQQIESKHILYAAALQDHYLRQANLNLKPYSNPLSQKPRLPSIQQQSQVPQHLNLRNRETLQQSAQQILGYVQIQQPTHQIEYQNEFQDISGQQQSQQGGEEQKSVKDRQRKVSGKVFIRVGHSKVVVKQRQSIGVSSSQKNVKLIDEFLDSDVKKKKDQVEEQKEEAKLKVYKQGLSLAQKLGLVACPPKPLGQEEWTKIEEMSKKREDGQCAICLDEFKDGEQVILSCSHTFHKNCLGSFEKMNKVKACPICRRQHYDKKSTDQGFRMYVLKCIVNIQKRWRGAAARNVLFKRLIQSEYKSGSILFRRRIIAFKIAQRSQLNDKLMEKRKEQNEKLLKTYQQNISDAHENIFNQIGIIQQIKNEQRNQVNQFQMYDYQFNSEEQQLQITQKTKNNQNVEIVSEQQWLSIKAKADQRKDKECAICFQEIQCHKKKPLVLLSCTHLFHSNCIQAMERYNIDHCHTCPICRSSYQKKYYEQAKYK